ncbi:Putative NADH-flavin reductase [Lysobacter sp. yr284]|uniref:SDR family oxidoreductase n=1 Tax=Lysobacter sp. yr284 TaxID=1761791 RepID=UPI000895C8C9|nr:SDR family oxidoreductase [Lysobacter sp. yr284]SDY65781.1 Putative NADH-flavin reductase [Lysobacter sp. yr284]
MSNVLILGASGRIAHRVIERLAGSKGVGLTLYLRHPRKLRNKAPANARVVQGDVMDATALAQAMEGQDLIYANLTGSDIDRQARSVVAAMKDAHVKRLIFVVSLGIYDEVPGKFGQWNNTMIGEELRPFRRAADTIEASGLDYTLLRPAWLQEEDEVDYEITEKGLPFKGTEVSRASVADLIVKIVRAPELHSRGNVGVNKPGTDGDKPSFY